LLRDVVALLPFGLECTERAGAKICLDGRTYLSEGFDRGPQVLRRDLVVEGHARGYVEVSYPELGSAQNGTSFSAEEADLIGAVAHILGVGIERRRAKESLGEAERKFLSLFNNAHNGVLLIERHTKRCCRANRVLCQMLGYVEDEIGELQLSDIQPPQSGASEVDPLYDPLIGQHALRQDVPLHRKDGSLFFADVSSFPVTVGNRDYWLDIFKDVTERTLATVKQGRALQELRTANREFNDFVTLVSHDLKAVRRGMALLAEGPSQSGVPDAEFQAQRALVADRVNRLDDLVTMMARYVKIGRSDEPEVVVRLDDLVEDLLAAMAPSRRALVEINGTLPVVRVRWTLIGNILACLLDSALRQMDQAQGTIRIACQEEGDAWRLSVSDSGPGMAPQCHEGLFRLFQATPNGHWEDFGTALAMARRSVEACGGRIWLESAVGAGTRVSFTLPKTSSTESGPEAAALSGGRGVGGV
jgi:PAS domain S-box-containing protein